ncbi:hypothetical protein LEP1GSC074_0928 [Leptospira noguchii str. Hook]|nr:hypothetical protein LEP1GSC074_0928 [Leptospira noguchii str. Hook]
MSAGLIKKLYLKSKTNGVFVYQTEKHPTEINENDLQTRSFQTYSLKNASST